MRKLRLTLSCGSAFFILLPFCNDAYCQSIPKKTDVEKPSVHFSGEVKRGQAFEKALDSGEVFRLEPYAGNASGWTIRIAPDSMNSASIDCIGPVSEPLHGDKTLEIEPQGAFIFREKIAWFSNEREFYFIGDPANCKAGWDLANAANYSSKLSDKQREEAGDKLAKIQIGSGVLTVIDSQGKTAPDGKTPETVDWLKFEVKLTFPASVAPQSSVAGGGNTPKEIEGADVERFLTTRYEEIHPELDELEEECPPGTPRIHDELRIAYGDLDGDGQEEAVYEGFTCMSGTAGYDFVGVVKLQPNGKFVALPIEAERKEFKGRQNLYENLRGKVSLTIENGRLVELFPVYKEGDANCCPGGGERKFIFRWDGRQFVLDDIIDVPPDKSVS